MKNYIVVTFLLFIFVSCEEIEPDFLQTNFLGEGNPDNIEYSYPEKYNGISENNRTTFVDEDYSDNTRGWIVGSDTYYEAEISGNQYNCETKSAPYVFYANFNSFNSNKNYEVEIVIDKYQSLSWSNYSMCGLVLGYQLSPEKMLYFAIDDDTKYFAGDYNGGWGNWHDETYSDAIVNEGYNKLTVRKYEDTFYFFINEILVDIYDNKYLYDNNFGFVINKQNKVTIKSFRIDYIE